jgi:hypothetical protein
MLRLKQNRKLKLLCVTLDNDYKGKESISYHTLLTAVREVVLGSETENKTCKPQILQLFYFILFTVNNNSFSSFEIEKLNRMIKIGMRPPVKRRW